MDLHHFQNKRSKCRPVRDILPRYEITRLRKVRIARVVRSVIRAITGRLTRRDDSRVDELAPAPIREIGERELVHASRQHAKHFASDTADSLPAFDRRQIETVGSAGPPSRWTLRALFASDTFVPRSLGLSTKSVDSFDLLTCNDTWPTSCVSHDESFPSNFKRGVWKLA